MTGTAAEVTPVRAVDDVEIGVGPVTLEIQQHYLDTVNGRSERWSHWLDVVEGMCARPVLGRRRGLGPCRTRPPSRPALRRRRPRQIGLSAPWLDEREEELVLDVLRSGRLSLGPTIDRFEEAFAEAVGAPYAAAVSSGTAGLHLLCVAAGIEPGDEVITSPYSFVASANCAIYEGATPVFADIDRAHAQPRPGGRRGRDHDRARAPSSPSTSSATRSELEELQAICERHGLALIDDACEALGARLQGAAGRRPGPGRRLRVLPQQADHDRRGRHRHDPVGGDLAAAQEPSQPGARRRWRLARPRAARLQLPDRRHPARRSAWASSRSWTGSSSQRARRGARGTTSCCRASTVSSCPCPDDEDHRRSWFVYVVALPEGADREAVIAHARSAGVCRRRGTSRASTCRATCASGTASARACARWPRGSAAATLALPFHARLEPSATRSTSPRRSAPRCTGEARARPGRGAARLGALGARRARGRSSPTRGSTRRSSTTRAATGSAAVSAASRCCSASRSRSSRSRSRCSSLAALSPERLVGRRRRRSRSAPSPPFPVSSARTTSTRAGSTPLPAARRRCSRSASPSPRRCGQASRSRRACPATRLRIALGVVIGILSLPWLSAELGFHLPGRRVPRRGGSAPGEALAAVHLGHHHGLDGALLVALRAAPLAAPPDRPVPASCYIAYVSLAFGVRRRELRPGPLAGAAREARLGRLVDPVRARAGTRARSGW